MIENIIIPIISIVVKLITSIVSTAVTLLTSVISNIVTLSIAYFTYKYVSKINVNRDNYKFSFDLYKMRYDEYKMFRNNFFDTIFYLKNKEWEKANESLGICRKYQEDLIFLFNGKISLCGHGIVAGLEEKLKDKIFQPDKLIDLEADFLDEFQTLLVPFLQLDKIENFRNDDEWYDNYR